MVESRFQIKKLVGVCMVLVGVVGAVYIGYTYLIWGRTLPAFPNDSELTSNSVSIYGGGFGSLLGYTSTTDETEVNQTDFDGVAIHRVLGDSDTTNGNKEYDTGVVSLTIPRLDIVDAKVALDVNGDDEGIYDGVLTQAVAHLNKSAYPGEVGNVFLFGHSMLPILASNSYESIFTNLPKLRVGDIFLITKEGVEYTYQITQTGVVDPTDVFIMNQPLTKRMATLMTCIPPGFSNQRYVTVAELIDTTRS